MSAFIDLTGKRFGRLIVVKRAENIGKKTAWVCQCDCGNKIIVIGSNLKSGHTQSCGCISKEQCSNIGKKNKINLLNQTIGNLTITKEIGRKNNEVLWECLCSCGNIIQMTTSQINKGMNNFSCGCKSLKNKKIDLLGQKFGLLTVVDYAPNDKNSNAMWKCKCDCGKEIIVQGIRLRNGNTKSCGCNRINKLIEYNSINKVKDITGEQFGELTVLEPTNKRNNNKSVMWKCQCSCGNICFIPGNDLRSGNTKSCGCKKNKSFGELKIQTILQQNNIDFVREYSNENCRFPNSNYLARFDFYLPDYNTLIEYDGKQHSIIGTGKFDNPDKFKLIQEHDNFKNGWAKENGYTIIRIPYTQYDNLIIEDLLPNTSTFIIK